MTDARDNATTPAPAASGGRAVAVVVGVLVIAAAGIALVALSNNSGESRERNDNGGERADARSNSERTNTGEGSTANAEAGTNADLVPNNVDANVVDTSGGEAIAPPPADPTLAQLGLVAADANDPRVQAILERFRFGEWAQLAALLGEASFEALAGALLASPTVGEGATQLQRLLLAELAGDLATALKAEDAPIDPAMVAAAHAELLAAFLIDGEAGSTRMPSASAETWPPGTAAMWREARLLLSLTMSEAPDDPACAALFQATLKAVFASAGATAVDARELRALQAELLDVFTRAGVAPIDADARRQMAAMLATIPRLDEDGAVTADVASLRAALLDALATAPASDPATREAELALAVGFATDRALDLVDREAAARLLASGPVDAGVVSAVATLLGSLRGGQADATVAAQALQTLTAHALDHGLADASPDELASCARELSRLLVDTAADPNAAGPLRVEALALVAEVAIAAEYPQGARDFATLSPTTMSELVALSEQAIARTAGDPGYDAGVRQQAVCNLATLGEIDEDAFFRVRELAAATSTAPDVAATAMQCLDVTWEDDRAIIHAGLAPTRPREVRIAACGQLRGEDQFDRAARLAREDADPELRLAAVRALARCTSNTNREQALELALNLSHSDSSPAVRNAAGALASSISRELER